MSKKYLWAKTKPEHRTTSFDRVNAKVSDILGEGICQDDRLTEALDKIDRAFVTILERQKTLSNISIRGKRRRMDIYVDDELYDYLCEYYSKEGVRYGIHKLLQKEFKKSKKEE